MNNMKNLNLKSIWTKLLNRCALRKVFDDVIGVYCDGAKIFCIKVNLVSSTEKSIYQWQVTDMAELFLSKKSQNTLSDRSKQILMEFNAFEESTVVEADNELDSDNNDAKFVKIYEMVAEKVASICSLHKWETKNVALCLNHSDVITEIVDFAHIPKSKMANAAHYQISVSGDLNVNDVLSSFMELETGVWIEGILKSKVKRLTDIWLKNKMSLIALTAMPDEISSIEDFRRIEQLNNNGTIKINDVDITILRDDFINHGGLKALFAAKTLISKSNPNFLIEKVSDLNAWNFKRITAAVVLISFIGLGSVFSIDYWNYRQAISSLEHEKTQLSYMDKEQRKQKFIEANLAELETKNRISAMISKNSITWRSLLIHLGTLKINGVWLKKIYVNDENVVEISCEAVNYETMANFVKILENDVEFFSKGIIIKSSEMNQNTSTVLFVIDLPL